MRRMPLPRSLWSTAKVGALEIQQVLPKRGRGPRLALVWGWPTLIRWNVRTEPHPARGNPCTTPPPVRKRGGSCERRPGLDLLGTPSEFQKDLEIATQPQNFSRQPKPKR